MISEKKGHTLLKKLIKYFLIIILCMAVLNTYSILRFRAFNGNALSMLNGLDDIYSITINVNDMMESLNMYTCNDSRLYGNSVTKEDYRNRYYKEVLDTNILIDRLKTDSKENDYYIYTDLQNMVSSFNEESKKLLHDYDTFAPTSHINESMNYLSRLKGYIEDEVKSILVKQLNGTMAYYKGFLREFSFEENLIYFSIVIITAMCILLAVKISREISKPIHQLVLRLMKVATGEFETTDIAVNSNDEIKVLVDSFNFMTVKIKELVGEIQQKAELERELKEEQIKNLEMQNLLKQSEVRFLQSQINPHFLYNTLNSISGLALSEDALETMKMIGCVSDILKYYLKKINETVTLMEEFKVVENYLFIQKARFGQRFEYSLVYDNDVMDYLVPGMILQPFVENAIIHGLEPKEERGQVSVSVKDNTADIVITVKDDGIGMNKEVLEGIILNNNEKGSQPRGIGVLNVIRRLEIKYGRNIVDIKSIQGIGTEVIIKLPKAV